MFRSALGSSGVFRCAQDNFRVLRSALECPVVPWSAQCLGLLRGVQEYPGMGNECPGVPGSAQERPGAPRSSEAQPEAAETPFSLFCIGFLAFALKTIEFPLIVLRMSLDVYRFSLFRHIFKDLNPEPYVFKHFHKKIIVSLNVFAKTINKSSVCQCHFSKCK